jgi:hypothetical protein
MRLSLWVALPLVLVAVAGSGYLGAQWTAESLRANRRAAAVEA